MILRSSRNGNDPAYVHRGRKSICFRVKLPRNSLFVRREFVDAIAIVSENGFGLDRSQATRQQESSTGELSEFPQFLSIVILVVVVLRRPGLENSSPTVPFQQSRGILRTVLEGDVRGTRGVPFEGNRRRRS